MVLPLLLRAATSSIVKSTAKNAVKGAVKSKAKDFIRGKSKKKSGALVKDGVSKAEVRPISSALVPIKKIDEKPDIVDTPTKSKVSKTESRTDVIEKQLNNIVNLTSTLNSLVLSQYNQKKKTEEKRRKKLEKEKKRKREEEQETEKPGSGIVRGAVSKAKQFNIFDALLNFFLGAGLLRLISFLKGNVDENGKPKGLFKSLSEGLGNVRNLFYGFKLAKAALGSLLSAIGRGFKAIPNLFKSVVGVATKAVKGIGGSLVKGFKGLLGGKGKIFTFFKGIVDKAKKLASAAARLSGIDTRTDDVKNARKRLKELEKLRKLDGQTFSKPGPGGKNVSTNSYLNRSNSTKLIEKKYGNSAAKIYENAIKNGKTPVQAKAAVDRAIKSGKIIPNVKAGNLAGGIKGSSLTSRGLKNVPGRLATRAIGRGGRESLRGISKVVGGGLKFGGKVVGRIPIIGPLIILASNLLDPEIGVSQSLFRAGGAALGGGIGAALVGGATVGFGAILGGIVGEVLGEYLGDLLYIAFKGGGINEVGKKIQKDISEAFTAGGKYLGKIKNWAKKGFERLYEGLPKTSFNIFGNPFGINDIEFLEPDLLKIIFSAVMNIPKAFFSDDPMKPGKVDKKNENVKRKVGTKSILNGKPVIWAGDNYGWQSPESYKKLYPSGTPSTSETNFDNARGRSPQPQTPMSLRGRTDNPYKMVVTSDFGKMRGLAISPGKHMGVDIAGPQGVPLQAFTDGEITATSPPGAGYGNWVAWKDDQGIEHFYGHMVSPTTFKVGDKVKKGTKLGEVGNTGNSSGPHLHWEAATVPGDTGRPKSAVLSRFNPLSKYSEWAPFGGKSNPRSDVTDNATGISKESETQTRKSTSSTIGTLDTGALDSLTRALGGNPDVAPETDKITGASTPPVMSTPSESKTSSLPAPSESKTSSSPVPAQVTPGGTSQNTEVLEQYAEYENGGEENVVVPIPVGGGGSPVIIGGGGEQVPLITPGGSPETMVNNWWRVQLLGFLYKQG